MNLRFQWTAEYYGPNLLAQGPAVVAELSIEAPEALPTIDQLVQASRELWAQSGMDPSFHRESGIRTADPQDVLLIMGEVAAGWARAALNEVRGCVLYAGSRRVGERVELWIGFHHPPLSRAALQLALQTLVLLLNGRGGQFALKVELERLWGACRRHHPDFQARILMVAAQERDIPYLTFLSESRYWQFGWGEKSRVFFETASNADGALGWLWQRNKVTSKDLMRAMGLPTPLHVLVSQEEELPAAVKLVGFPCVVKPLDGGGGKGVTANINDTAALQHAFRHARQLSHTQLMVEQHLSGIDYRLMVVGGKLIAAIQREASYVIGDGASTVGELLNQLNADRFDNNLVKSRYLKPIPHDEVLTQHLRTQAVSLEDVLPLGRRVTLRSNANRSTGGIAKDVTDRLHPQIRAMAEQFALATGLDAAGLDYLTSDITKPSYEVGGAFIEINATPGLAVFVAAGWTETEIGRLLLGDKPGRIPIELTILSPERLSAQLESLRTMKINESEGWVCGNELCIGLARMHYTLNFPWGAVRAALRNPRLKQLQVFCSAQDIQRYGLPLDGLTSINVQDPALEEKWVSVLEKSRRIGMNK